MATLLEPLLPDGTWQLGEGTWEPGGGAWRLVAAAQLGADRQDPRLGAGMQRLLDEEDLPPGWDGTGAGVPWCSLARLAEAAAYLGWERHPLVGELLARLAEAEESGGWACALPGHGKNCAAVAVGLLAAAGWAGHLRRHPAVRRALDVLRRDLGNLPATPGAPNLGRTDLAEACMVLARLDTAPDPGLREPCLRLQAVLGPDAFPARVAPPPAELGAVAGAAAGESRLWGGLAVAVALSRFAVPLALPRRFPEKE